MPGVIVVGAGPAGLAVANTLLGRGVRDLRILEAGLEVAGRRRDDPRSLVEGVGGAGLYSDGKFSFYPSATRLWTLPARRRLEDAYAWTAALLDEAGLRAPAFPHEPQARRWSGAKPYPSHYLDLDHRARLIETLAAPLRPYLALGARVIDILYTPGDPSVRLVVTSDGGEVVLEARHVIFAGGRFVPLLLGRSSAAIPMAYRRVEVGVRLVGAVGHPFFAALEARAPGSDPKIILPGEGVGWRTFCFCDAGEVVTTELDGFSTLSGRADGAPTGSSNVGFNVRLGEGLGAGFEVDRLKGVAPFDVALEGCEVALEVAYGHAVGGVLSEGLERLRSMFPELGVAGLRAMGPTLEGVGRYPVLDGDLQVRGAPMSVVGDGGGLFRGLVGALVSGAYVGLATR